MAIAKRMGTFVHVNRWLLAGVIILGGAAYMSATYVKQMIAAQTHVKTQVPMQAVLVASKAIAAYTPITAQDLTIKSFPTAAVPAGAFTSTSSAVGSWTNRAISPGLPVVSSEVFSPKSANVLASRITPGDLAIDVPISATNIVDGMVMPGDHITLFTKITGKTGQATMEDFMNNVQVLAVNGSMAPAAAATTGQNLTLILALPPKKVTELLFAEQQGTLIAALNAPHSVIKRPTPYTISQWQTPIP